MPEHKGVEASADLVDVEPYLGDIWVSVHKFVNLQFILQHVGLDGLALTQKFRPVANAKLSGRETCIFLLVGQHHQNNGILLYHIDTVPEIRSQGQGIGILGADIAIL